MARGGRRPGAGRKPNSPNKTTRDARERFRQLADDVAIPALARIAKDGSTDAAIVSASKEILDRAFGKSPQPLTGEGGEGPAVIEIIKYDGKD